MLHTITMKALRPALPAIIQRVDGKLDRYVITRRGKPVVVMLSVDDYDALMETLDILADREALKGIRQGESDIRQGKTKSWKEIKASLGKIQG